MPQLRFLRRPWHIASDDLPLPSLLGAAWHLSLSVLIAVDLSYVVQYLDPSCSRRIQDIGYLATHLGCVFINATVHIWTYFESIRGSMFEVSKRRRVGPLILTILFLYLLTIGNNIYGTRLAFVVQLQCLPVAGALSLNHSALLQAIVVATWISLFIGSVAMVITFNLFSTYESASSPWESRCMLCHTICCCCVAARSNPGSEPSFGAPRVRSGASIGSRSVTEMELSPIIVVANIFTHVFGAVDMTFTDYVASFTLVGVQHRLTKPAQSYANVDPPAWLQQPGLDGSSPAGGGKAGSPLLRAPQVLEMSASGRSAAALEEGPSHASTPGARNGTAEQRPAAPRPQPESASLVPDASSPTAAAPIPVAITIASETPAASHVGSGAVAEARDPPTVTVSMTPEEAPSGATPNERNRPGLQGYGDDWHAHGQSCGCGMSRQPGAGVGATAVAEAAASEEEEDGGGDGGEGGDKVELPGPVWSGVLAESNVTPEVMDAAVYYMRFAMAVYGWKMYMWMNRTQVTHCCKLCVGRRCGCCRQSAYFIDKVGPYTGPSEGCWNTGKLLEREAITQITEVADDDILYVCYDNEVGGLLPYYIAVDRQRQAIVVAIRGSMSLSDIVTDLVCAPAQYRVPGWSGKDSSGQAIRLWAHRGMVEATAAIWKDILEQGVLDGALAPDWGEGAPPELPSKRALAIAERLKGSCAGWPVVVTGHSLGAGVTGLLGPVIRSRYPNVRCWAYAPPGGLMSPEAAELTRGFCISVIHAKDMIPRLAVGSMEQLVQRMVRAAVHCQVTKAHIMGWMVALGDKPGAEELFKRPKELTQELLKVLQSYNTRLRGTPSANVGERFGLANTFVPPGHVLYVERRKPNDEEDRPCCTCNLCLLDADHQTAQYACRWIHPRAVVDTGLIVSRSMFTDHLPDTTMRAMQNAYNQLKQQAGGVSPRRSDANATATRSAAPKSPGASVGDAHHHYHANSNVAAPEAAAPEHRSIHV